MKLTKEQVISIDAYLKKIGIKHWDIRLEMIDHIATQTEESGSIDLDFETSNRYIIKKKYELKNIAKQKIKFVHKKCRASVNTEILRFFKSLKYLLILLVSYILFFKISTEISFKIFYRLSIILIFFPMFISIGYMIFNFIKKNNSIHLEHAIFYLMFPFSILNMFFQLLNSKGHFFPLSNQSFEIFLLLTIPIYLVLTFIGFKVYLNTLKYYTKTYKDYLSVCP